ncbi:hypothetical protein B5X24_HaOG208050 [Helicoverpa armigera]|nr:hypothetical protein B5X24_HaOG208050 [Helicoverpa armigera]
MSRTYLAQFVRMRKIMFGPTATEVMTLFELWCTTTNKSSMTIHADTGDTSPCILRSLSARNCDVTLSAAITRILDYDFPHLRQCSVSNTIEHSRRVGGSYRSTGTSSSDSGRGDAKSVSVWRE